MDNGKLLSRLVQVGNVSAVNAQKKQVRVIFPETGITSGWLYVLQHTTAGIHIVPDAKHTHTITDIYTGGGSADTFPDHNHPGSYVTIWMPKVNEKVVVLHLPVADGDGFVLGGI